MKCRMNCDGRKSWFSIRTVAPGGALVAASRTVRRTRSVSARSQSWWSMGSGRSSRTSVRASTQTTAAACTMRPAARLPDRNEPSAMHSTSARNASVSYCEDRRASGAVRWHARRAVR